MCFLIVDLVSLLMHVRAAYCKHAIDIYSFKPSAWIRCASLQLAFHLNTHALNVAVLDFTMQLMETGFENDAVLALVVFSLQYVLVNHEYWKYKVKHTRWRITLKVHLGFLLCFSSWFSMFLCFVDSVAYKNYDIVVVISLNNHSLIYQGT